MSQVKFKETVNQATGNPESFAHEVGAALTKGAGPNGYLQVRTARNTYCEKTRKDEQV